MKMIDDIKELISEAKYKLAVSKLKGVQKSLETDSVKELILISSRLTRLESDERKGILTSEDRNVGFNRIGNDLFTFLETIPKSFVKKQNDKNKENKYIKNLLFISANPLKERLKVDIESREIKKELRNSLYNFQVNSEFAVDKETLEFLKKYESPEIIHLAGHSKPSGKFILQHSDPINYEELSYESLFEDYISKMCEKIECVFLNIENSQKLGEMVSKISPVTIGIKEIITDESAIVFSSSFYSSISLGSTYKEAFDSAINSLDVSKIFYDPKKFGYSDDMISKFELDSKSPYYFMERNKSA